MSDDSESQIIEFYSFKHENYLFIPFEEYDLRVFFIKTKIVYQGLQQFLQ